MGEGSTRSQGPVRLSLVPNYNLTSSYHRFGLLGGGGNPPIGTFSTYCVVTREQVILTPAHPSVAQQSGVARESSGNRDEKDLEGKESVGDRPVKCYTRGSAAQAGIRKVELKGN